MASSLLHFTLRESALLRIFSAPCAAMRALQVPGLALPDRPLHNSISKRPERPSRRKELGCVGAAGGCNIVIVLVLVR
jgi:hypothetical protein